jgi:DNA modification methylase
MARLLSTEQTDVRTIQPHPRNVRQGDIGAISRSLKAHGQYRPIVIQQSSRFILAGNHTYKAAIALGWSEIATSIIECDDDEALRILLADNKSSDLAAYDESQLAELLRELSASSVGLEGTLYDGDDLDQIISDINADASDYAESISTGAIAQRFGIAPFSLLDCRRGWWKERRKRWLDLGITSEVGRDGNLLKFSDTVLGAAGRSENLTVPNSAIYKNKDADRPQYNGTSVFDPVLCELAYRWFCPTGGTILDPFAGGSVRGIVASHLGMNYRGIELRPEQVEANRKQYEDVGHRSGSATWIEGDSARIIPESSEQYDFVFSCPPYHSLEVYSDLPGDLSAIEDYEQFLSSYEEIIRASASVLRDNRFACWVISEIRDADGRYRNFVGDTIEIFERAGLSYYNEGIYIQQAGSWPLRIGRMFGSSRKIARLHQNLLVFVKGDPRIATEQLGEAEWGFDNEPQMLTEAEEGIS